MIKNQTEHNIRLTSTEIASLWTTYMNDSMAICTVSYILEKVEDTEIRPVLEYALHLSKQHVQRIKDIFEHEAFPIPQGFTEEDVNLSAPRLFSDTFFLIYLNHLGRIGLSAYSVALTACARSDVRDLLTKCIASSTELFNRCMKVLLSKGLYIRSPYVPTPDGIQFVEKQGFLNGWWGERRPLNVGEISGLYINLQNNSAGKVLFTGFSQIAKSQIVREYMVRGANIASKHMEVFSSLLIEEKLPAPMSWDDAVMDSTIAPFSDKLMMFHAALMCSAEMGNYGAAIGSSMRRDITGHFSRLMAEVALLAEDGANIMIENGWMEKMPVAPDRRALARV